MRRTIIIDYNTERNPDLVISPVQLYENEEVIADPVMDMDILCEAVSTMIKLCHAEGLKKDSEGIRHCIEKLKKSFSEISYKTLIATGVETSTATEKDKK
jgi:hypothetical protein